MKIYIAGKITGDPGYRDKFAAAEIQLGWQGHTVLNPAELPSGMSREDYMRICFAMIDVADAVVFLRTQRKAQARGWKWHTANTSRRSMRHGATDSMERIIA